jgi:hypothetical protein
MLLAEISAITSSALAARWAQDALPRKNSLTAADAKLVEDAFESRLSELPVSERSAAASEQTLPPDTGPVVGTPVAQQVVQDDGTGLSTAKHSEGNSATPVDKSVDYSEAPLVFEGAGNPGSSSGSPIVEQHSPADGEHPANEEVECDSLVPAQCEPTSQVEGTVAGTSIDTAPSGG